MKTKINTAILRNTLAATVGASERKGSIPILSTVLLAVKGEWLYATCYNTITEICAKAQISDIAAEEGATCVDAHKLLALVSEANADEVYLECDGQEFILLDGRNRFKLSALKAGDFPNVVVNDDEWKVKNVMLSRSRLESAIAKTRWAMATSDVRYYLNGTLFCFQENNLTLVATDGHRLAKSEIETKSDFCHDAIIPKKAIDELASLLKATSCTGIRLYLSDNHLMLQFDNYRIYTKLVEGRYPDWRKVIPKKQIYSAVCNRDSFASSLRQAIILSDEKTKAIKFSFGRLNSHINAATTTQDESRVELDFQWDGVDLQMGMQGQYVIEALKCFDSEEINLSFVDASTAMTLKGASDPNTLAIIMPMRV